MSSSDSNAPGPKWSRHYEAAAQRRRARGWHRRDESGPRKRDTRFRVYVAAGVLFVALTLVAMFVPLPR